MSFHEDIFGAEHLCNAQVSWSLRVYGFRCCCSCALSRQNTFVRAPCTAWLSVCRKIDSLGRCGLDTHADVRRMRIECWIRSDTPNLSFATREIGFGKTSGRDTWFSFFFYLKKEKSVLWTLFKKGFCFCCNTYIADYLLIKTHHWVAVFLPKIIGIIIIVKVKSGWSCQ